MEKTKLVFKEYTKRTFEKSSVWNSFLRTEDGKHAQCKVCKKILQCSNTTTCLHNHLKSHHSSVTATTSTAMPITPTTSTNEEDVIRAKSQPKPKKARMEDYYQKTETKSMETVISKMAASDGIPFSVISNSESIRMLFQKSGYDNLPKSPNTVKNMVLEKSDQLKSVLKKELAELKANGQKFSVSLDEWTSARNRRFINVNIHCPKFHDKNFRNLGLARITGRGTSERCLNILQVKLAAYDLTLEDDIAGVVTDGASVMTAMGRLMPSFHQLCLAHGIQCAVVDVIYKNRHSENEETLEQEEIDTGLMELQNDETGDEETEENDGGQGFVIEQNRRGEQLPNLNIEYKDLIEKVRRVVKFFKKSPTRTEYLDKYVHEEHKSMGLVLDCRTRWNSMADMVSRFLLLKDAISKALIDLKDKTVFSTYELALLQDLSTSLTIVKTTVEVLCEEKATLITAETAIQFMVTKLQEIDGSISGRLLQALKMRITQRRQTDLVCTLKYLLNPKKYYQEPSTAVFPKAGNAAITKTIIDINKKYYHQRSVIDSDDEDNVVLVNLQRRRDEEAVRLANMSMKEQLQRKIADEMSANSFPITATSDDQLETSIKMEMALYDGGAPRQIHLNHAYDVLMCIPPTSVECERVFSSSKYICNHLRNRLNDDSLDALSFLRSHFLRIRK